MRNALPINAFLLAVLWILSACNLVRPDITDPGKRAQLEIAPPSPTQSFSRVTQPRDFSFPIDHGPHTDYQTEWWYYTGNLTAEGGERFSYQLTVFRRGLSTSLPERDSNFGAAQIFFAHFAIAAIDREEHHFAERFSRGALGLAGASGQPYEVFLENWRIRALNDDASRVALTAVEWDMALNLELLAVKPLVIHGDGGVSPKSAEVGHASYYLSYTRMETTGSLDIGGETYQVSGTSWFDHEWSTAALEEGVVGWDWYSLQLDNQQELMLYVLRRDDGALESASAGTLIRADGSLSHLALDDFSIEVGEYWISPETGASYPSQWRVSIPGEALELEITPNFNEQEMLVSFIYWEGSVRVEGAANGIPITGVGFVELTGYLESMAGVF